ncbi:serine/threonine-protein kinase ULK3 isoform X2 [Nematostella vectensis]|nr:serine/threonine-protein kinase ULK3 isoform X2 [Nematostella vectensis]
MEYCGGGDLSRFIHSKRALPERMARKFLRQLACALQYMRSYDVAHMDLKPQNLLLSSRHNPVLKIADFGFAQKLHPNSEASNIRGSPLYMAPEMICCQSYDASVDLWSVGVILYETLFGEPPFKSKTFVELEAKLRSSEPIKLPPGPRVSADCRDLLIALLQRDPKQRISFEAFFIHPFIDMEHMPSSTSLQKAVGIVSEAVSLDKDGSHKEAAQLYCQAMEYFVPAVEYETDPVKKTHLRERVVEYMNRAEELKQYLKMRKECVPGKDFTSSPDQLLASFAKENRRLQEALRLAELAEIRDEHEHYEGALRQYQVALEKLLPLLNTLPKGIYRDALRSEIDRYMKRAEEIKLYLKLGRERANAMQDAEDESSKSCVIQ